jgi:hypothetical protein
MCRDVVGERLTSNRVRAFAFWFVMATLGLALASAVSLDDSRPPLRPMRLATLLPLLPFFLPGALALMVMTGRARDLLTPLTRQPDGTALKRYGEPQQVIDAVNAEMAGAPRMIRIGERHRSFRMPSTAEASPYSDEVYLTPSWIVSFSGVAGDRLTIFRLADIVLASRVRTPWTRLLSTPYFSHSWVTLIDRHAVRLNLLLPNASAARLLAEVLTRVPWALGRFNLAARHTSDAAYGHFVAEANRRREEFRLTGRTPPTSPS